jgi:hypothetical protein
MASKLLPSPVPDEHLVDYVRRTVDHGLGSDLGAELGLIGVYRDLSDPERKIFVAELINRFVHALGPVELAKFASRRRTKERE